MPCMRFCQTTITLARLRRFTRNSGVSSVFVITPDKHLNHPILLKACETEILRDAIGIDANNNNDYRSLRTESVIATDVSGEISTLYRKPKALIMEDDKLHNLKNKTDKAYNSRRRTR